MERNDVTYTAEEIDALLKSGSLKRLGMGSRRACYVLPGGARCLKCYRSEAEIEEGKVPGVVPTKPLAAGAIRDIRRYRFDERHNTCCQEYRYWLSLKKRLPVDLMAVFPSTMELVFLPSRGWAVVEELVANADGTPPKKFAEGWWVNEASRTELLASFNSLTDALVRHAVRFYDPPNILSQRLSDGSYRLRIMDFEPTSHLLIQIDLLPAILRCKIRRRFARYLRNWAITQQGGMA